MQHHVLVETNWVVEYASPILARARGAAELLARSREGHVRLHVPSIALLEARKVIRERSPRDDLGAIRSFLRTARVEETIPTAEIDAALTSLSRFEAFAAREKSTAPERIRSLLGETAISVFALDDTILERTVQLAADSAIELASFDMAILSAVLVQGSRLREIADEVTFCTLDADLQPWDRKGARKNALAELDESSGVRVVGDFLLEGPPRPAG